MKKTICFLLVFAVIIPIVLLFWPFAAWDGAISIILRIIPAMAVQVLLCIICKSNIAKIVPALLTGVFATWGTYLFFTSPHWSNATVSDLIADYVSPFIACFALLLADKEKELNIFRFGRGVRSYEKMEPNLKCDYDYFCIGHSCPLSCGLHRFENSQTGCIRNVFRTLVHSWLDIRCNHACFVAGLYCN